MTARITARTVWTVGCDRCSYNEQSGSQEAAASSASQHDDDHALWDRMARALVGKVYDTDAADAPWAGHIATGIEQATAAGFSYLTWNGWVYATANTAERLCLAADLRAAASAEVASR